MKADIIDILLLVGLSHGFLLGFIILFSRFFKSKANFYFGLTILDATLIGVLSMLILMEFEPLWIVLLNDIMLIYLLPVFFLFYYLFSFDHPLGKQKKRYWLYVPFVIVAIINILIDLDTDFQLIHLGVDENMDFIERYYFWETIFSLLYTIALSVWAFVLIKKNQEEKQNVHHKWYLQFWIMINLLVALWLIDIVTDLFSGPDLVPIIYAGFSLFFYWVSYRGIYQFNLAQEKFEIREKLTHFDHPVEVAKKYSQEGSENIQENVYLSRLHQMMEEQHLYRDPEVSRDIVAEKLGISSGYFSQIFNKNFESNFSEYLNEWRIKEVKNMLTDPEFGQYSLVAIGYEAGFKSKSNFFSVFKKATGSTPSAYKKQILVNPPDKMASI